MTSFEPVSIDQKARAVYVMMKKGLRIVDIASRLGVSVRTVQRWLKHGEGRS